MSDILSALPLLLYLASGEGLIWAVRDAMQERGTVAWVGADKVGRRIGNALITTHPRSDLNYGTTLNAVPVLYAPPPTVVP